MKSSSSFILFGIIGAMISVMSCTKDDEPANPYDAIDRPVVVYPEEPDPNSITGLHKHIFFPVCANPGCHDGTFEPDYRTVESTFSTLVYQRVNKVTLDSVDFFSERVIPYNTNDSWLVERLTTLSDDYMPSNSSRLSDAEIGHVKNWINAGCPDANGDLPVKPNLQPNIVGYFAADSLTGNRIDSIRVDNFPLNPFIVQSGNAMRILFVATDTADGNEGTDPAFFSVKEIRFSTDKNNFTGAIVIPSFFYLAIYQAWLIEVPGNLWPPGTTVYFRIYVNDGDHASNAEFPRNESIDYYKTLYAFYVQ